MGNNLNMLAGVGAGGTSGTSLAFFAPQGTAGPVGVAGTDGVQTVAVTGTPTGGTFTLTWNGYTTAPIAYNATSAAVTTALRALPGGQSITSSGGPLPTGVAVTFPKLISQSLMTADPSALTGGSSPAVTVTNTTPGTQSTNSATASIPSAFKDAGLCDQKGLGIKTNVSSNAIKSFGSLQTQRTLKTDQSQTFDITFQETNPVSLAVYRCMPIGSITADASGFMSVAPGQALTTLYAGLFYAVDGKNIIRYYAPNLENTSPGDLNVAIGQIIDRPVTFTAYPDANGVAVYESYVVDALKV